MIAAADSSSSFSPGSNRSATTRPSTSTSQAPIAGRSGKLDALDDLLDVILSEGESVLVFSQYVQMCRLIEAHLAGRGIQTLFLHGQTVDAGPDCR